MTSVKISPLSFIEVLNKTKTADGGNNESTPGSFGYRGDQYVQTVMDMDIQKLLPDTMLGKLELVIITVLVCMFGRCMVFCCCADDAKFEPDEVEDPVGNETVCIEEHDECLEFARLIAGPIKKFPSNWMASTMNTVTTGTGLTDRYVGVQLESTGRMWCSASLGWWSDETTYQRGDTCLKSLALKDISSIRDRSSNDKYYVNVFHWKIDKVHKMNIIFPTPEAARQFHDSLSKLVSKVHEFNRRDETFKATTKALKNRLLIHSPRSRSPSPAHCDVTESSTAMVKAKKALRTMKSKDLAK